MVMPVVMVVSVMPVGRIGEAHAREQEAERSDPE
jgi:hypothetical protein